MYTLSADTEFGEQGSKTGINYHLAFRELKAIVDRFSNTEFGQETLELWQRSVFEGQPIDDIEVGHASLNGVGDVWDYIAEKEREGRPAGDGGQRSRTGSPSGGNGRSPFAPISSNN
jgi:hypothetical protein